MCSNSCSDVDTVSFNNCSWEVEGRTSTGEPVRSLKFLEEFTIKLTFLRLQSQAHVMTRISDMTKEAR